MDLNGGDLVNAFSVSFEENFEKIKVGVITSLKTMIKKILDINDA